MKNSKFNPLFESIYSRFKDGSGFLAGDVVKLKSNYKSLDCYKKLSENVRQRIEDMVKTGNNIRVGRLHNAQFSNSYGALGGTDAPAHLADCYEEVAPSFWRNLVTLPVECLETANPAFDLPPVPANQKDKQRAYQKPLEATKDKPNTGAEIDEQTKVGKKQTRLKDGEYKLATDNTKLEHSNKYDDSKPSKVKGLQKVKELNESVEGVYNKMLAEGHAETEVEESEDDNLLGTSDNPRTGPGDVLPVGQKLKNYDPKTLRPPSLYSKSELSNQLRAMAAAEAKKEALRQARLAAKRREAYKKFNLEDVGTMGQANPSAPDSGDQLAGNTFIQSEKSKNGSTATGHKN